MKCRHTQYLGAEAKARDAQWLGVLMTVVVVVVERWLQTGRAAVLALSSLCPALGSRSRCPSVILGKVTDLVLLKISSSGPSLYLLG